MRAIFLSLVILNGLFAVYVVTLPSDPIPAEVTLTSTVPQLRLVNEVDESELSRTKLAVIAGPKIEEAKPAIIANDDTKAPKDINIGCQVLGPYKSILNVRQARSRATGQALVASIRRIQVPAKVPIEHWVFIPPRENRQSAVAMFKRLQANSFDSFLMTRGKNVDAISLGLFRNHDSARRLLRKAIGQGFPAEIQVMEKYEHEYWLEMASDSIVELAQKNRIKATDSHVQWQPMACSQT